jgi:hypothetical protein
MKKVEILYAVGNGECLMKLNGFVMARNDMNIFQQQKIHILFFVDANC